MSALYRVLMTGTGLAPQAREILTDIGALLVEMDGPVTKAAIAQRLDESAPDAILLRGNPPICADLIAKGSALRVIAKHGVGVDSVDIAAATAARIPVMVAGDANASAVAEHAIAMILALARDLAKLSAASRSGQWLRSNYKGRELRGRTLGLVGFGRIGRRVAEIALALGLNVIVLVRRSTEVDLPDVNPVGSLDELFAGSDIVSLHAPLTSETRHLVDRSAIARMRPGAILVNTARGALVDEVALCEALHAGRLAGAALDTLTEEPPDPTSPILSAPNLILTPHIAAQTAEALIRMGIGAATNIAAVLTGGSIDPDNLVNPEALA